MKLSSFLISKHKRPWTFGIVFLLAILSFYTAIPNPSYGGKDFGQNLSQAALERTKHFVIYNGSYRKISYPNGDVPAYFGVCTDVVIRSYRVLSIDLQKRVHEDMKAHFKSYPKNWGLKRTDTNIDHRRVRNLQVFFTRKGQSLKVTHNPRDYKTGDLEVEQQPAVHRNCGRSTQ